MAPQTLTGAQKAALLLMQVGAERSAKVLKVMRDTEVAELMAEVTRLRDVDGEVAGAVIDEFTQMAGSKVGMTTGGIELARAMLEQGLEPDRANDILSRVTAGMVEIPFEFLRRADPRQVLSFLQDEHPQTIALVLGHLPPDQAAMIISGLPEALQRDVSHRIAVTERTSADVVTEVERVLEHKMSTVLQPSESTAIGGVQALVDILNRADRGTERLILEALEETNPELAEEVRQRMFVFEDITTLEDKSIQLLLRSVDTKDLAMALKGVRNDVRQKVMRNLSERASANLSEEIEMLGPVRLKSVEEAQGAIVRTIRSLEESGQIVLTRSADEYIQ